MDPFPLKFPARGWVGVIALIAINIALWGALAFVVAYAAHQGYDWKGF